MRLARVADVHPRLEPFEVGMPGGVEDHDLAVENGAPGAELGRGWRPPRGSGRSRRVRAGPRPGPPSPRRPRSPGCRRTSARRASPGGRTAGRRSPRASARGARGPPSRDGGGAAGVGARSRARRPAWVTTPGGGDLIEGPAALDRAVLGRGVVAGDGRFVPLLDEQEVALRLRAGSWRRPRSPILTRANSPASFSPRSRNLMSPFRSWASGSSGGLAGPLEGAGVPELHRAHPVPGGDHPLEVAVIDGVVLGLNRQAAAAGVQGGSARDRPGEQDAAVLEPEVVVETGRPVHLDAEATALREPVPEPSARQRGAAGLAPLGSGVRVKSRLRRYSSRATTPRVGRSNPPRRARSHSGSHLSTGRIEFARHVNRPPSVPSDTATSGVAGLAPRSAWRGRKPPC